jgi:hypothetical protein
MAIIVDNIPGIVSPASTPAGGVTGALEFSRLVQFAADPHAAGALALLMTEWALESAWGSTDAAWYHTIKGTAGSIDSAPVEDWKPVPVWDETSAGDLVQGGAGALTTPSRLKLRANMR